ncbi:MAG TPA: hypothetical protein VNA15_05410 [Candidatus Angelobacter sp.]|nr:hypothetical protein [Candidatus Angelobacter sp.]
MQTRTLLLAVRGYIVVLLYLQVALILAGNGIATFPWGVLTLGPKDQGIIFFADQGIIFVLTVPGVLGMYLVNARRRLEEHRLAEQAN